MSARRVVSNPCAVKGYIPFAAIAAVDVGSPNNLGLAINQAGFSGGVDKLDEFIQRIATALSGGAVALGFECPCFLPIREDVADFTKARCGEGNRAWSAGAGANTSALVAPLAGNILRKIRNTAPKARPTFNFRRPANEWCSGDLLLFEAFVSGKDKGETDKEDAEIAVGAFESAARNWPPQSAINETSVVNLLGAALVASGWDIDRGMLSEPCLVVKP